MTTLDSLLLHLKTHPMDAEAHYQLASMYDRAGQESEAVPCYQAALAHGLSGENRKAALLGLGSTFRCLGEYQKSLDIFNEAVKEYPHDRSLVVFRALTLFNLGQSSKSVTSLLLQLVETSSDEDIKKYQKALRFYAENLDKTWK